MKKKQSQNFLIGLIIGTLIGLAIWYWQKSTSAEDGALDLLDRLAVAERKLNRMRADLGQKLQGVGGGEEQGEKEDEDTAVSLPQSSLPTPDDLTKIKGIGPTYATRLHTAHIQTYAQLQQLSAQQLATILNVNETWATNILFAAQEI